MPPRREEALPLAEIIRQNVAADVFSGFTYGPESTPQTLDWSAYDADGIGQAQADWLAEKCEELGIVNTLVRLTLATMRHGSDSREAGTPRGIIRQRLASFCINGGLSDYAD